MPGATLDERRAVNYLEAGLIDSLAIIELIAAVEERWNIRFHERHFQDRRFVSIGGLGQIVDELVKDGDKGNST